MVQQVSPSLAVIFAEDSFAVNQICTATQEIEVLNRIIMHLYFAVALYFYQYVSVLVFQLVLILDFRDTAPALRPNESM